VDLEADDRFVCHARGPAAATSDDTDAAKFEKLSANNRASYAA
jgi:hypothetical protein